MDGGQFAAMDVLMLGCRHDLQILQIIVVAVTITMMHYLIRPQSTTQCLRCELPIAPNASRDESYH